MPDAPLTAFSGQHGTGTLEFPAGYGEYFDPGAMKLAQELIWPGEPYRRFSVEELALAGFVVDSEPFEKYFDVTHLKTIAFLADCMDAGFALPEPRNPDLEIFFPGVRHDVGHLHLVTLNGGRVVKREPASPDSLDGPDSLDR